MNRFQLIFTLIETAAMGAAEAIKPNAAGVAADIELSAALLAIVQQLIPHAAKAAQTIQTSVGLTHLGTQ